LYIKINQSQSDNSVDYFEMPVPVQLTGEGKDTILVMNNTKDGEVFEFDIDFKADKLVFDPDNWICAKSTNPNYLGTELIDNSSSLSVFPNPAINQININLNNDDFIKGINLYSLTGKKLVSKSFVSKSNNVTFSLKDLDKGIYLLKIISDSGVYAKKVIKQ